MKSDYDLYDLMDDVRKEMRRAAKIHGRDFESIDQALRVIAEENIEVAQAVMTGDTKHAREEIIQLIGVLVKLYRGLESIQKVRA